MRGVIVGLLLGIGLFCIWWSFWPREEHRSEPRRAGPRARLQDDITQAGYTSVSPGNVLTAGALAGLLVFALVQASARVVPVALCFASDGRVCAVRPGADARALATRPPS